MSDDSLYQQLRGHLAYLRMAAAAEALPAELEHAASQKLGHTAFLERLLARSRSRPPRSAGGPAWSASPRLPSPWRLDDFDFDAQPSIDKKLVNELATLRFLEDATNVLVHRAARGGQDHAGRRPGPSLHRRRLSDLLHDGRRPGGPLSPGRARGTVGHHHALLRRTADCWSSTRSATCPWPPRRPPPCSRSSPSAI